MSNKSLMVAISAGAAVVLAGVWWSRRAGAETAVRDGVPAPSPGFAPLGFTWNAQRGQYTRVNERGQVEVYAQDVYL